MRHIGYSGALFPAPYGPKDSPPWIGMFTAQDDNGQWYYSYLKIKAAEIGLEEMDRINRQILDAVKVLRELAGCSSAE